MILVQAPKVVQSYLDYVLRVVFVEWFDIEYRTEYGPGTQIRLSLDSGNESGFISLDASFLLALGNNGVQSEILYSVEYSILTHPVFHDDLPVIFGQAVVSEGSDFTIGFDLFGTIFFMLSRFEELVLPARDEHDRFPALASVAFANGFLERPIVDEYVEFLWYHIEKLWPNMSRKSVEPKTYISCDVDIPFDPSVRSIYRLFRGILADILKQRSLRNAASRVRRYICNKNGDHQFDPNYSFEWYMDVCEKAGYQVAFYFIPTSIEPFNGAYELSDPGIRSLLHQIDRRGHEIGVHGSYQTYQDLEKLSDQKQLLEHTLVELGISQPVKGNRQHYLRWDPLVTAGLLDAAGFEYDTTGGYADHAGFRFGTGREFSMWCWKTGKQLNIKQRPLIVMECSIVDSKYMGLGMGKEAFERILRLRKRCLDWKGNFSLLWHNSSFDSEDAKSVFIGSINA